MPQLQISVDYTRLVDGTTIPKCVIVSRFIDETRPEWGTEFVRIYHENGNTRDTALWFVESKLESDKEIVPGGHSTWPAAWSSIADILGISSDLI